MQERNEKGSSAWDPSPAIVQTARMEAINVPNETQASEEQ